MVSLINKAQTTFYSNIWFGLDDLKEEDTFIWADGQELKRSQDDKMVWNSWTYWSKNDPNNHKYGKANHQGQDCVTLWVNNRGSNLPSDEDRWKWNDRLCSDENFYICQESEALENKHNAELQRIDLGANDKGELST